MKLALLCLSLAFGLVACEPARSNPAPSTATPAGAVAAQTDDLDIIGGGQCGNNVCGKGTFCCNRSCGTCAPLGGACTQQICPETTATDDQVPAEPAATASADDESCGSADDSAQADDADADLMAVGGDCGGRTCGKGTYCCNASCGRCAPKGVQCTQESCN